MITEAYGSKSDQFLKTEFFGTLLEAPFVGGSTPPPPHNFVGVGWRPLSWMCWPSLQSVHILPSLGKGEVIFVGQEKAGCVLPTLASAGIGGWGGGGKIFNFLVPFVIGNMVSKRGHGPHAAAPMRIHEYRYLGTYLVGMGFTQTSVCHREGGPPPPGGGLVGEWSR